MRHSNAKQRFFVLLVAEGRLGEENESLLMLGNNEFAAVCLGEQTTCGTIDSAYRFAQICYFNCLVMFVLRNLYQCFQPLGFLGRSL